MKHRRLQELDRSDFDIVEGEPDIRGWDVKLAGGKTIGEVEELILDAKAGKVRYMVVDVDDDDELKTEARRVLIPIGLAELDKEDDDVYIPGVKAEHLIKLPKYDPDALTPEVEASICRVLGRNLEEKAIRSQAKDSDSNTADRLGGKASDDDLKPAGDRHVNNDDDDTDPEFYRHEYYNLDTLYKNRMHEAQKKNESEYEQGLRLWERRSEGGIIEDESRSRKTINEEARMEMVRNRRNSYEERRYKDDRHEGEKRSRNRGHSIIDRIKNEGLRDAGDHRKR